MKKSARPQDWVGSFAANGGPRYLQIVGFMEQAISDDRLKPGDRLPPQRQLADRLDVDLTTVTRAYTEARRRHLLEARGAAGSFVAAPKVDLSQVLDLSMNIPPPPAGIDLDDLLRQGVSQVLIHSDADLLMTYHLGGGSSADRAAGAMWLQEPLGRIDESRVLVCPGAQSALAALLLSQTRPGEVILAEPLAYPGLLTAAAQLGRRVVAVGVDGEGMRPDLLVTLARKHQARVVYLNPTLQNPTTHTMPATRRAEIAAVATRLDLRIIEDDPYWRFAAQPPRPLAYYAPRHVFHVSTLSKCLLPGLRTAYVVMPEGQEQEEVLGALRSFVLMSTPLMTALSTQWVHDGTATSLLEGIRNEAWARQELALRTLGDPGLAGSGGIHLWQALPAHWSGQEFVIRAGQAGLNVVSHSSFEVEPGSSGQGSGRGGAAHIRISLGRSRSRFELVNALRRLSELTRRRSMREVVV
ncbi:PLP-dependent aminotransferase family protein [Herbaspirillum sp. BH-1]|uniref:DNA-binding transcriptional MocR family regulator n=1 Tax=Herbaspirillum frisingense TaxID=92645 RepID=A0ABU1P9R6_9BURK|nr:MULTISPECIES: PLP-dependent aminotransferase family protein [Herbaspirillum]MDR6582450.1 DNA-binding transcriptional MocR family regulator [Herbaspirillum frisingense]PLY59847.1 PLP-dependent aminotransferase family protein [Herbaspirillum sp. BH-1]